MKYKDTQTNRHRKTDANRDKNNTEAERHARSDADRDINMMSREGRNWGRGGRGGGWSD